jgi:chromosome segregation ATPase
MSSILEFLQQNTVGIITGGAALLAAYGAYTEGRKNSRRLDRAEKKQSEDIVEARHQADINIAQSIRKSDLDVINIALASLKEDNVRLTRRLSESETRGDELYARVQELEKCIEKAETDLDTARGTIRVLTQQVEEWQHKYTTLNLTWERKYSALEASLSTIKDQTSGGLQ